MNKQPVLSEQFSDNGEHSHWHLIDPANGEVLWSDFPEETIASGQQIRDYQESHVDPFSKQEIEMKAERYLREEQLNPNVHGQYIAVSGATKVNLKIILCDFVDVISHGLKFNGKEKDFIKDIERRAERCNYYEAHKIRSAEMFGRVEAFRESIKIFKKFFCS